MTGHASRFLRKALDSMRRGEPEWLLAPRGARLGNYLYFWLHAYNERLEGRENYRIAVPDGDVGIPPDGLLASTAPYMGKRADVRLLDPRETIDRYYLQRYGIDFSESSLRAFISEHLAAALGSVGTSRPELLVNVRRGDYYSVPEFRGRYSFDVVAYIKEAIQRMDTASVTSVVVVSDDLRWCSAKLGFLGKLGTVGFVHDDQHPLGDMALIAASRHAILANSTYSYWGAYASSVLYPGEQQTIAPWFFDRSIDGGQAFQLAPNWTVIEGIPGGWDS